MDHHVAAALAGVFDEEDGLGQRVPRLVSVQLLVVRVRPLQPAALGEVSHQGFAPLVSARWRGEGAPHEHDALLREGRQLLGPAHEEAPEPFLGRTPIITVRTGQPDSRVALKKERGGVERVCGVRRR